MTSFKGPGVSCSKRANISAPFILGTDQPVFLRVRRRLKSRGSHFKFRHQIGTSELRSGPTQSGHFAALTRHEDEAEAGIGGIGMAWARDPIQFLARSPS